MASCKVFLTGVRLGQNPKTGTTSGGKKWANFSVAESRWNGESNDTVWHNVSCFGRQAELVEQYLTKGREVSVEGTIDYGSYEKDGQTVNTTNIRAFSITFHGSASTSSDSESAGGATASKEASVEDGLPF